MKHYAMKAYGGSGCIDPLLLTSALVAGEWPGSLPDRFTPRERASFTHLTGGWVDRRTRLNAVKKEKSCLYRNLKPELCVVQPVEVAIPTALSLERLRQITKGLSRCSPCSGRDSNRLLPEHKRETLPLEPTC
jgi:hypothetical protein